MKESPTFLICGLAEGSVGAELMLESVLTRLRTEFPGSFFAVSPTAGRFEWRCQFGLWQLGSVREWGRRGILIDLLMTQPYRRRYGVLALHEMDVVLDCSGFLYGDFWKIEWLEAAAKRFERYKRQGKLIVMMPLSVNLASHDTTDREHYHSLLQCC